MKPTGILLSGLILLRASVGLFGSVGTFVLAPGRVDMVHDAARDLLYISSGGQVLRYNLSSNLFLAPFTLGGSLGGMDLSPDGNTLAVADRSFGGGSNWVYLVDLPSGAARRVSFPLAFIEGGTWTVAYGNDGALLVSSRFQGSGWVPLRRFDPVNGSTTIIHNIGQDSMLTASADRSIIAVAESNNSGGPLDLYSVALRGFLLWGGTGWFNYEVGVNRNGTQFAVPTYGGTFIYNLAGTNLIQANLIGQYAGVQPIGVAYHPAADAVFFAFAGTSEVRAYHTVSWTELGRFDVGTGFGNPGSAFGVGRLKTSRDGSTVFVTVEGGVQYFQPNLVIPNYDLNHRLVIGSSPPNLGASAPLPYGTNWLSSPPDPVLTNFVAATFDTGGVRYVCTGWTGTGSVPATGNGEAVTFTLTNFSTLTWNWAPAAYELSVATNGAGSVSASTQWAAVNSLAVVGATPSLNYRFDHWEGDVPSGQTYANPLTLTMDGPRSLTAVFVLDTLSLVINGSPANIGFPALPGYGATQVLRNALVTNAVNLVAETNGARYTCTGWTGTGSVPASGTTTQVVFTITTNSSLVWDWQLTDYALTVGTNGSGSIGLTSGWYPQGSVLSLTAVPGPQYRFDHWTGDVTADEQSGNPLTVIMDRPRSVTAVFVLDTVPLVITGNPTNVGLPLPFSYGLQSVPRNTVIQEQVNPSAEVGGTRYGCSGWSGTGSVPASGTTTQVAFTVTTNSTLVWNWQATAFALTLSTNGNGSVGLASGWYSSGSRVSLTAVPQTQYRFDHWAGDVSPDQVDTNSVSLTMDQPRSVTAVFVLDTVPFNVTSAPGGSGSPTPDGFGQHLILRGSVVTNTAGAMAPAGGVQWGCIGWTGTGSVPVSGSATQVVFTLQTNSTITWLWQPASYQVTTSVAGRGSVSVTDGWFAVGSAATNFAIPSPGFEFARWFGDVPAGSETNNPQILTVNQPRKLIAEFVPGPVRPTSLAGDWRTFGNGPAHTGYFPGTMGSSNLFRSRWDTAVSGSLQQVAVGGGRIFVTPQQRFGNAFLEALQEHSGSLLWDYTFARCESINPPTYDPAGVFVQRVDNAGDTELWSFDPTTGTTNWTAPHGAQWEHYLAPTVVNGSVYVDGGAYGGMYGFNATNGAQLFFQPLDQFDGWTPTYYNGKLYTWMNGNFRAHDAQTGQVLWSTNLGWTFTGYTMDRAVAISDDRAHFTGNSSLYTVDLGTRQVLWQLPSGYSSTPAVANGIVYAIANDGIHAFLAATGLPLGLYPVPAAALSQPIVTDDIVIAATASATYVFDLGTFQLRQTLPTGGYLSLANGVLYVADYAGLLHAYSAGADVALVVQSNDGSMGAPDFALYGTNTLLQGLLVTASIPPLRTGSGARYQVTGWTGSGSVPPLGNTNSVTFVITNDSTLTWLWSSQYNLSVASGSNGTVTPAAGWYDAGSDLVLTATPTQYYHFVGWQGTTNTTANPLALTVSGPEAITAQFAPDLVTNGVPVWWLLLNGLEPTDAGALADTDGDGFPNWEEYLAGTDPHDPKSRLTITSISQPTPEQVRIRWQSVAGKTYRLWYAPELRAGAFTLIATNISAAPPLNTFSGTPLVPAGFYLIELEH